MRNCGGATEEEASPAEILAQATLQAEKARHALTTRRPKTDVSLKIFMTYTFFLDV